LRRQLAEIEGKNNEPQFEGPFTSASDEISSFDLSKIEEMRKNFDEEKEELISQRNQAEQKCINVKSVKF